MAQITVYVPDKLRMEWLQQGDETPPLSKLLQAAMRSWLQGDAPATPFSVVSHIELTFNPGHWGFAGETVIDDNATLDSYSDHVASALNRSYHDAEITVKYAAISTTYVHLTYRLPRPGTPTDQTREAELDRSNILAVCADVFGQGKFWKYQDIEADDTPEYARADADRDASEALERSWQYGSD